MHRTRFAFRRLLRHPSHAAINVLGLGLGLASVVVIFSYVAYERSYDTFHPDANRIYQVSYQEVATAAGRHVPTVSPPTAPAMVAELPEVEQGLRFRIGSRHLLRSGDVRFFENGIVYADSSFFDMLGFRLLSGNPDQVLRAPDGMLLTASMARKYFGDADPVGREIVMDGERRFTVEGVVRDLPRNTHIRFDFLLPFDAFRVPRGYPVTLADWQWISFPTFVKLAPGANPAVLDGKLADFMTRHFPARSAETARLRLQPISDVYLNGPTDPAFVRGNAAYLNGLLGIAVLILLLSAFNFSNLSAADALRRGRETGVRRVLGASGPLLWRQMVHEASLTAAFGAMVAVVLIALAGVLLPFAPGGEGTDSLPGLMPWLVLGLAVPVLGVMGGTYPALLLHRMPVEDALRDRAGGRGRLGVVRNVLVVLQFSIAVGLIISSLVVSGQLGFVTKADLGFERDRVLAVQVEGERLRTAWPALRDRLEANPQVLGATLSGHLMDGHQGSMPMIHEGSTDDDVRAMNLYGVDFTFAETMGLEVIKGRTFDRSVASDSAEAIVINRAAADYLAATTPDWSRPLGRRLQVGQIMEGRVIGVVEDFHYASLHQPIDPLVMIIPRANMDNVLIRVAPGDLARVLPALEQSWRTVVPDLPFDYRFLDDHLGALYIREAQFLRLVTTFSVLAILIACLGLFGLVSFVSAARAREVAVRKVLGARIDQLVSTLLAPFWRFVLLANVVAWPVVWLLMDRWLDSFAYRVDLGVGPFAAGALASILIALVTVAGRTVRTALADPTAVLAAE